MKWLKNFYKKWPFKKIQKSVQKKKKKKNNNNKMEFQRKQHSAFFNAD